MNFNRPLNIDRRKLRRRRPRDPNSLASARDDGSAGFRASGLALALGTALASGAWSHYEQHRRGGGHRRAKPRPDSAGSCCGRAAERRYRNRHPAGHHLGVLGRQYLCACQRLHRQARGRYRRPRENRTVASRNRGAGTRSSDRTGGGDARSAQGGAATGRGKPRARQGHVGSRRAAGEAGLADRPARHHRRSDPEGAGSWRSRSRKPMW